ncbi:MAG: hypothetical protein AAF456_24265 [Planctomycetota bacterium]
MSKCARCQGKLPPETNYCVGCGHYNEDAMVRKVVGTANKIEEQRAWRRFWNRIFWFLRGAGPLR